MAARIKLGELCHVVTKGTTPTSLGMSFADEGVPFLRIQNLRGSEVKLDDVLYIDNEVHQSLSRSIIKPKDFLITIAGTIGRVAIVPDEFPECNCNQAIAILRFDNERLDARWLYHWLSTSDAMGQIAGKKVTATISNLSLGQIKDLGLPLPYPDDPEKSLKEQKRIAAILDKADGIRRKRKQAIQLADDFLRSVFLDMFGDPVTNPKGWDTGNFGEVIQTLTDYHSNGSYETLNDNVTLLDNPDYAYMVRTTDLQKNDYTENVKYISESAYHHLSKSKVFGGEIIINKIGSAGSVYLMPKLNRPVSLAMNQFLIRCKEGESNTFYYYLLKTKSGERELKKRTQGAVTKTITKNAIREVPVIMPPNDIQCKFLGVVAQVTKKLNEGISASSIKVEDVFYSLSQKAFKGEL